MTAGAPHSAERAGGPLVERLFRNLSLARRVEEEVARIYPSDRIKSPVHLSIGQEAVAVGVCAALRREDAVFATYRGHAAYLAKGGDLRRFAAELFGKSTGCAGGKGGSMHLIDRQNGVMGTSAIVAATIPHAVGYAYAQRLRGSGAVVACFFGDGAVEEGVFHESLNLAQLKRAPVLFVCENNGYAIHSRLSARQARENIAERAGIYGIPFDRVADGDVFSIYAAAERLLRDVRGGDGPRFLECLTYRWREHVGPGEDWNLGYRSPPEARRWLDQDPVETVGRMLTPDVRSAVDADIEQRVRDAFEFADTSPYPDPAALYTDTPDLAY